MGFSTAPVVCLFVKAEVMCLSADFIRDGVVGGCGGGGGGCSGKTVSFRHLVCMFVQNCFIYGREYKIYSFLVAVNGICALLK